MQITREMIEALDDLRKFSTAVKAERYADEPSKAAALAVDLLDNEDFFAAIDDEREAQSDPDSQRPCGCGAVGVHGVDHDD